MRQVQLYMNVPPASRHTLHKAPTARSGEVEVMDRPADNLTAATAAAVTAAVAVAAASGRSVMRIEQPV